MNDNIVWHHHRISKQKRSEAKNQKPCVLWFTGFSGSGKSTIAGILEEKIALAGGHTYLLDGDNIRHGLCCDLYFSNDDRIENIRRIAEVSKLFVDAGLIVLTAFISPFREDRERARKLVGKDEFVEIFVDTPLEECVKRDPKGLYSKARNGVIKYFTGIDSSYEAPLAAEIRIDTRKTTAEQAAENIFSQLREKGYLCDK